MTERLKAILHNMELYNPGDLVLESFGLSRHKHYDVLVVAPGWKPTKIMNSLQAEIKTLRTHSYISGYEVITGSRQIGWIQTSSGACNLIDGLLLCAELNFDKLVFIGAVGGLTDRWSVGDICTPRFCVDGTMASAYLQTDLAQFAPFKEVHPSHPRFISSVISRAKTFSIDVQYGNVFCTDSISCEYSHLPFIRSMNVDLIEMETGAFYRLAQMLEKPAIALLVVSDNSASGKPLLGMSEAQEMQYNLGRKVYIPRLIEMIAEMDV